MPDNNEEKSVANIGEVPVRLTFDLGEEVMPFREVTKLKPGYLLNLKQPFTNVVKIRSQNRLIGKGELVDIEGKVGVRITKLFGKTKNG